MLTHSSYDSLFKLGQRDTFIQSVNGALLLQLKVLGYFVSCVCCRHSTTSNEIFGSKKWAFQMLPPTCSASIPYIIHLFYFIFHIYIALFSQNIILIKILYNARHIKVKCENDMIKYAFPIKRNINI